MTENHNEANVNQSANSLAPLKKSEVSWLPGEIQVNSIGTNSKSGVQRINENSGSVPAGRYFMGDPCYAANKDNKAWSDWVDVAAEDSDDFAHNFIAADMNGLPVVGLNTRDGDGSYPSQDGDYFPVDAGMIGLVHEDVVKGLGIIETSLDSMGKWVVFEDRVTLSTDSEGTLHIGDYTIFTGSEDEDEFFGSIHDEEDEG